MRSGIFNLTLTVPSEEALRMWWPSGVNVASLTNEVWPRNSFRDFPDFSPWILVPKKEGYTKPELFTTSPTGELGTNEKCLFYRNVYLMV